MQSLLGKVAKLAKAQPSAANDALPGSEKGSAVKVPENTDSLTTSMPNLPGKPIPETGSTKSVKGARSKRNQQLEIGESPRSNTTTSGRTEAMETEGEEKASPRDNYVEEEEMDASYAASEASEMGIAGLEYTLGDGEGDVYSTMDMNKLLASQGTFLNSSMPAIPTPREFATEEERHEEFEKIYGKLKRKESSRASEHGDPPTPNNLYEALQSNFLKSMAKAYLYRLVLVGTHSEDLESLINWFKELVEDINVHCYSEIITGVLVLHPHHFIHVLEGSEDTLIKFMKAAADQFEPTGLDWKLDFRPGKGVKVREPILFTSVKTTVIGMFRIKHRGILSGWKAERALASAMVDKDVPAGGFREKLFQFTKSCCIMGVALYKLTPLRPSAVKDPTATEIDEARARFEIAKRKRGHSMEKIVPKAAFIDYIIKKDEKRKIQLRNLREHVDYFWKIPVVITSQQTDWPVPGRLAAYD